MGDKWMNNDDGARAKAFFFEKNLENCLGDMDWDARQQKVNEFLELLDDVSLQSTKGCNVIPIRDLLKRLQNEVTISDKLRNRNPKTSGPVIPVPPAQVGGEPTGTGIHNDDN